MRKLNLAIAVLGLVLLAGCVTNGNKITQEHDKFTGASALFIKQMPIGDDLYLSFYASQSSKAISKQGVVGIIISSESKGWRYLKNHRLDLLADNERINIGNMKWDGDVAYADFVVENMTALASMNTFMQIASATTLTGRIGRTEFTLTPEQMTLLRELAQRVNAAG